MAAHFARRCTKDIKIIRPAVAESQLVCFNGILLKLPATSVLIMYPQWRVKLPNKTCICNKIFVGIQIFYILTHILPILYDRLVLLWASMIKISKCSNNKVLVCGISTLPKFWVYLFLLQNLNK